MEAPWTNVQVEWHLAAWKDAAPTKKILHLGWHSPTAMGVTATYLHNEESYSLKLFLSVIQ